MPVAICCAIVVKAGTIGIVIIMLRVVETPMAKAIGILKDSRKIKVNNNTMIEIVIINLIILHCFLYGTN